MTKINIFFFSLITLLCLYVNFQVFNSYLLQYNLIGEFNSGELKETTFNKIKDVEFTLPNITVTVMPLNIIKADYYFRFKNYAKALEITNQKINDNPFLFYKESLKAKIFIETRVKDSALFYSELAFFNLPNNLNHFKDLTVVYGADKNYSKLQDAFNMSSFSKSYDTDFWELYLSTIIAIDSTIPNFIKKDIEDNYFKLQGDNNKALSDEILYGKINISKSNELILSANNEFLSGNFDKSLLLFRESIILNPKQYASYENAALCLINLNEYEKALIILNDTQLLFPEITVKSKFLLGLVLVNLGRNEEACKYLSFAYKNNYKDAFALYNSTCK